MAVETAQTSESPGELFLEKIADIQQETSLNRSKLESAEGESRAAIFLQIIADEEELRSVLDDLLGHVETLEEDGQDSNALISRVKTVVTQQSTTIYQDIETAGRALAKLNEVDRSELPADELEQLNQQVAVTNDFLDKLYIAAYENIKRQKALDLNPAADIKNMKSILQNRVEKLAGYVELTWRQMQMLEDRISRLPIGTEGKMGASLQSELYELEEKLGIVVGSLNATVDVMDKLELETVEYRLLLIKATGNVGGHAFNAGVISGLVGILYDKSLQGLADNGPDILVKILVIIAILLLFKMIAAFSGGVVRKALNRSQLELSVLLKDFFVSMASKAVMLVGLLIVLTQLGIEIGPALAGLGILGFIVGFALQETLSNFASGLMILAYRPFDVDDVVEVAGHTGKVRLMSLVSTTIVSFDNQRLVIPNTKIWGGVIRNITAEKNRRVDLVFGIGYGDDIGHAEKILREIIDSHELILKDPGTDIKLNTLGESSVDFVVRPWVRTKDYWTVYWDIIRAVKDRFDKEGISIPYPQRDIHLHQIPANPLPVEQPATP
ncbi:MAG: mechanosensitive ion channel family protein [Pseudomonadota bacterium]|nr:mechanosensitive ion channel family protein [Pseudomonadota bacterium]